MSNEGWMNDDQEILFVTPNSVRLFLEDVWMIKGSQGLPPPTLDPSEILLQNY